MENNLNKPTDNAGKITAEEIQKAAVWLSKQSYQTEQGEQEYKMYFDVDIPKMLATFTSLVAEERCREKDKEIIELKKQAEENKVISQQISRNHVKSVEDKITLEKTINWKDQQLEIRDKQMEEWKQNEVKAIKTMLDQADRIKELKQQVGEVLHLKDGWPLKDVLAMLAYSTDILLNDKSYDGPKYEEMQHCSELAKTVLIPKLEKAQLAALTAHQEQKQEGETK